LTCEKQKSNKKVQLKRIKNLDISYTEKNLLFFYLVINIINYLKYTNTLSSKLKEYLLSIWNSIIFRTKDKMRYEVWTVKRYETLVRFFGYYAYLQCTSLTQKKNI